MRHNSEKLLNRAALISGVFLMCSFGLLSAGYKFPESKPKSKKVFKKEVIALESKFFTKPSLDEFLLNKADEVIVESIPYTEEELDMLSRVIFAEAGSDCISDEHQQLVGAVVLNRIADPRFPDTMKEVIWAKGQYACIQNGTYWLEPSERAIENARKVLSGEVTTPNNLVFQAEFIQGEVYKTFKTPYSTTYFCLGQEFV